MICRDESKSNFIDPGDLQNKCKKTSEPGFTGLGDYRDSLLYIQNRDNHIIPLILVLTFFATFEFFFFSPCLSVFVRG